MNFRFPYFEFATIRITQMHGPTQELDLEPQKSSMLARGFGDRNFFISFFWGQKMSELFEKHGGNGVSG